MLTHKIGQRSPAQVVNRLCEEGTTWLRRVPAKFRHHTFTMITYERGTPRVYVISNFERPNGPRLKDAAGALFCTSVRPRGPRCIVTGWSPAVVDSQRTELADLLASAPSPQRLREAIALTSRDASVRGQGTVGESCVVSHLCPDGSGQASVFGNLPAEFIPTMIVRGENVATRFPDVTAQAGLSGPHRLVGATWTANGETTMLLGVFRELSQQSGSGWPTDTSS